MTTSDAHWHPTTADEMKAFVGINIAMGVKDLPEYRDYWLDEPILHDAFVAGAAMKSFHCWLAARWQMTS